MQKGYQRNRQTGSDTSRTPRYRRPEHGNSEGPKPEKFVIPPIPENETYDSYHSYQEDEEVSESAQPVPTLEDSGLKYDPKLNKYMDGIQMKVDPTRTIPMKISCVDDEGYIYMTTVYDEGKDPLDQVKRTMAMLFSGNALKENNKMCTFEDLIEGEIVVALVRGVYDRKSPEYIRARIISINFDERGATVADVDTMKEYTVGSQFLYRAFQVVMALPFQAIKCTLKGLDFFEGTDVIKKLFESSHCANHQPFCGFRCTLNTVDDRKIPEVDIKKFGITNWQCADDFLVNLGSVMGARYRLFDGPFEAQICQMDKRGNVWIHFREDRYVRDKLRQELTDAVQIFDKTKELTTAITISQVIIGNTYIAQVQRNNCSRAVVRLVDFEGCYAKNRIGEDEYKRVFLECMDTGIQFWAAEDELVELEQFPPLVKHIPAMCTKIRIAGVKSFSKAVLKHQFRKSKFRIQVVTEWPEDLYPSEVRMSCPKSDDEPDVMVDITSILKQDKGAVFYTEQENEEWAQKRKEAFAKKENKDQQNCVVKDEDLQNLPAFMIEKLRFDRMNEFEKLKGPFNGSFSGLSGTPWLDLSVDGNNAEWTRRERPLPLGRANRIQKKRRN